MNVAMLENILEDCDIDPQLCYSAFSDEKRNLGDCLNDPSIEVDKIVSSMSKVESYLRPISKLLPVSTRYLLSNLVTVILVKETTPYFLYIMGDKEDSFPLKAGIPIEELPSVCTNLPVDLAEFYKVHNGWMDTLTDIGMLSTFEFEVFRAPDSEQPNFLKVFQDGPNAIGFDLDSEDKGAYMLSVELDEVRPVEDFWDEIDEMILTSIDLEE